MQERRTATRFRVDLQVRWETLKSQGTGALSDLSAGGCFVLTGGEASAGELVRLQIVSKQHIAQVWGHVIDSIAEMGFAVQFVHTDQTGNKDLQNLLSDLPPISD